MTDDFNPEAIPEEPIGEEEELFAADTDLVEEEPEEETAFEPEPLTPPSELSVHVQIEVGSTEMTADALFNMQPGNTIELNQIPHQVNLVVGGKCIGRGELMQIGDVVGVRVTQLG